ncbi:MAG: S53 family peptidase [Phycisphaerae bacterium]|nr:S53 family peptidase [Phycisphaerae bacterium]
MKKHTRIAGASRRPRSGSAFTPAVFEGLELRQLLSAAKPTFVLFSSQVGPNATTGSPGVFTPAEMRTAYGLNSLSYDGANQTIAIIDAYNAPTLASDLQSFDSRFGLANPALTIESQTGSKTSLPVNAPGRGDSWALETSLDVEWAHVIAPKANILVVEANSDSDANLYAAVDTARKTAGVSVVSMSWGGDESAADSSNFDSHFTTPSGHAGVTFVASAGDSGAYSDTGSSSKVVSYPAVSANVVAVGGTDLTTDSSGNYVSESGWGNGTSSYSQGGSGGGISKYVAQPSYQKGIVTQSSTNRAVPDVSMDADPNTGVAVVDSYDLGNTNPVEVGGTSLAAPMWAGMVALADQDRAGVGLGSLDGATQTLPRLYALPTTDFHDVTTGNNGYAAGSGYDLVTGRGTPIGNLLIPDLANTGSTTTTTTTNPTAPVSTPTPVLGIGSLSANPSSAVSGSTTPITLTASNVNETNGTISSVGFYLGSTFLGTGSKSGTTWTLTTTAAALSLGNNSFSAVATDGTNSSSPASTTVVGITPTTTTTTATTGEVLGWNVTGQTANGKQNLAATTVANGLVNSTTLTRGSGVSTSSSAPANAWGGTGWATNPNTGFNTGKYLTFGLTVGPSKSLSLSTIDLNYQANYPGPLSALWLYQINGGTWTSFANVTYEFPSISTSGAAISELNVSGVSALQNLAANTSLNIRLVPYNALNAGGTFYIYDRTGDDLRLGGTVKSANAVTASASGSRLFNQSPIANSLLWSLLD